MSVTHQRVIGLPFHRRLPIVVLCLLFGVIFEANAHDLSLNPAQPTSGDTITIIVSGNWPAGGSPAITHWSLNGTSIRIDALGILPGIPQPIVPYALEVDIGKLVPGLYHVDYYLDVLAAPVSPPKSLRLMAPDASLEFVVASAPQSIPLLTQGAVKLLIVLLLLPAIVTLRWLGP